MPQSDSKPSISPGSPPKTSRRPNIGGHHATRLLRRSPKKGHSGIAATVPVSTSGVAVKMLSEVAQAPACNSKGSVMNLSVRRSPATWRKQASPETLYRNFDACAAKTHRLHSGLTGLYRVMVVAPRNPPSPYAVLSEGTRRGSVFAVHETGAPGLRVISVVDGTVGEEIEGTRGFVVRAGLTPAPVG